MSAGTLLAILASPNPPRVRDAVALARRRFRVVTWHGEGRSVWYVVDTAAPASEQPAVIVSYTDRSAAELHAARLNSGKE